VLLKVSSPLHLSFINLHLPLGNQIEEEKGEVTTVITTVLPALDDFVDGLGTWKDALKDSWSQKYFNTLYAFLKGAYSKEKVTAYSKKSSKEKSGLSSPKSCLQRL